MKVLSFIFLSLIISSSVFADEDAELPSRTSASFMDCLRRIQGYFGFAVLVDEVAVDQSYVFYSKAVESHSAEARIRKNILTLSEREIPDAWLADRSITIISHRSNDFFTYGHEHFWNYKHFVRQHFWMWALVDKSWTKELSDELARLNIKKCLEVGGGRGWLSKAISEHSLDVICTDINPRHSVCNVEKLDAVSAIKKYGKQTDALIISWPYKTADQFIEVWPTGKWVIYIGEGPAGCNANINFFNRFKFHKVLEVPTWEGLHDACLIGKKVDYSDDFSSEGSLKESLRLLFPRKISRYW